MTERSQPNSADHTPTPWQQHDNVAPYGERWAATVWTSAGPGYGLVADCRYCGENPAQSIANAKIIVKAVNNHDALVQALQLFADPASWRLGGSCDPNSGAFRGLEIAQKALAALEDQS